MKCIMSAYKSKLKILKLRFNKSSEFLEGFKRPLLTKTIMQYKTIIVKIIVQPVYYGHLGTNKSVLIIKVS